MTYTATTALPYIDADRAISGLRGQLRALAGGDGTVPDWSTLHVTGPTQVIGARGVFWYEWTATVDAMQAGLPASLEAGQAAGSAPTARMEGRQ